jgi:hypothetical protein
MEYQGKMDWGPAASLRHTVPSGNARPILTLNKDDIDRVKKEWVGEEELKQVMERSLSDLIWKMGSIKPTS